jgi:hypothetical protein
MKKGRFDAARQALTGPEVSQLADPGPDSKVPMEFLRM